MCRRAQRSQTKTRFTAGNGRGSKFAVGGEHARQRAKDEVQRASSDAHCPMHFVLRPMHFVLRAEGRGSSGRLCLSCDVLVFAA